MDLQIYHYEFYEQPRGKELRYVEGFPSQTPPFTFFSGSTENVGERPAGLTPWRVGRSVGWSVQVGKYRVDVKTGPESSVHFTFRWDEGAREHVYFWWNEAVDSLALEMSGTGDNDWVNCTLGNAYFGDQVDTSRLLNGHSPSRAITPGMLAPESVWVHDSGFGNEAVVFLSAGEERDRWTQARTWAAFIQQRVNLAYEGTTSPEEVHGRLVEDADVSAAIDGSLTWYFQVMGTLKSTELYKAIALITT